ncbi:hypothetical protein [Deinococcus fonticola]|uniref:hypothetical protein n=1 Tax=Deinococcus fonticola TaxID=2528713 RepID=UPI0010754954|nr:hypothetical protein [Deinococcus fonticola]
MHDAGQGAAAIEPAQQFSGGAAQVHGPVVLGQAQDGVVGQRALRVAFQGIQGVQGQVNVGGRQRALRAKGVEGGRVPAQFVQGSLRLPGQGLLQLRFAEVTPLQQALAQRAGLGQGAGQLRFAQPALHQQLPQWPVTLNGGNSARMQMNFQAAGKGHQAARPALEQGLLQGFQDGCGSKILRWNA